MFKLFAKWKKRRIESRVKKIMPTWVTWDSNSNVYKVDSDVAFPLFLKSMGLGPQDMNKEVYHACRRGIAKSVSDKAPLKGAVRLTKSKNDWHKIAREVDSNPSWYRKYIERFKKENNL